ncbi:MAG: acyltransferase [Yoonia sp.]|nr:acyltransferase [Yoonia sp.]
MIKGGGPQSRNATIDILRSVGIIHVVLFHVLHGVIRFAPDASLPTILARYPAWMNFTWQPFGVDIIFMVSAYLLSLGLISSWQKTGNLDLRAFYVRRMSRIIPLYYIAIIVFALAQKNSVSEVMLAAAFIQFLTTGKAIVPVGWSMELMMLVYVTLPAVIWLVLKSRHPFVWAGAAILSSLALRYAALAPHPDQAVVLFTHLLERETVLPLAEALYFQPYYRITPFLVGIALAILKNNHSARIEQCTRTTGRRIGCACLGAVLFYVALFLPIHDPTSWIYGATNATFWVSYWSVNGALVAIGASLFIICTAGLTIGIRGPWALISHNIMGIYLFHMPLILVGALVVYRSDKASALGATTVWHIWGVFLVAAALSLGLATLLNRFVEMPIQSYLRRKLQA